MKFAKFVGTCPTCDAVCMHVEQEDGWYQCMNCTWFWEPKEETDTYTYQCPTCQTLDTFPYPLEDGAHVACVKCRIYYVLGEDKKEETEVSVNTEYQECTHSWASYGPGKLTCVKCWLVKPVAGTKEAVDHPAHYGAGTYEAINVIEAWDLGFNLGNAIKYIARAGKKGDYQEDLKKAIWYLQREVAYDRWKSKTEEVWFDPYQVRDE